MSNYIDVLGTRVLTAVKEREMYDMWENEENVRFELKMSVWNNDFKSNGLNDATVKWTNPAPVSLVSKYYCLWAP